MFTYPITTFNSIINPSHKAPVLPSTSSFKGSTQDSVVFQGQSTAPDFPDKPKKALADMGLSVHQGKTRAEAETVYEFIQKVTAQEGNLGKEYIGDMKDELLSDMHISTPEHGGLLYLVKDKNRHLTGVVAFQRYTGKHEFLNTGKKNTQQTVELSDLYVDKGFWGTGVAAALADGAEQQLKRMGYETIVLRTNTQHMRAHTFYRKVGYRQIDGIYTDAAGQQYLFFEKELK